MSLATRLRITSREKECNWNLAGYNPFAKNSPELATAFDFGIWKPPQPDSLLPGA
jgi:hypothetical protein